MFAQRHMHETKTQSWLEGTFPSLYKVDYHKYTSTHIRKATRTCKHVLSLKYTKMKGVFNFLCHACPEVAKTRAKTSHL